jgi:hypothetical protein
MKQNALEKVKFHLNELRGEDGRMGQARFMNKMDVDAIEKVLDFCKGDLNQVIDLEQVFKNI